MKTSAKGVCEIAEHEGIVVAPYFDSVGVLTWGVGHTAAAGVPDPRSISLLMPTNVDAAVVEAIKLFAKDLKKYEDRVNRAVKVPLKAHEYDALVSFDFNTGGIHRANLTKLLNAGDKKGAAAAFMGWLRPPELRKRRTAEMNLFLSGNYDANGDRIPVWGTNGKGKLTHVIKHISGKELLSHLEKHGVKPQVETKSIIQVLLELFVRIFKK